MTGSFEPETWCRGQYVEVFGLVSQTGRLMNKQRGIVIKANDCTGRIDVCLGAEGKMASLKPQCLRLVPGASPEEIEDAKDVAGPALRVAQDSWAQPVHDDIPASTADSGPPKRERSRSWSPPPEAVRAASLAGAQASSAASARGLSSVQAEALGAAAAEQLLQRMQQESNLQKQSEDQATDVSVTGGAATLKEKPCSSFERLQIGDSVQAVGLKGADAELNGKRFVIENFKGWGGPRSRKYVVSTTMLVIDKQGDPAEQKKVLTLLAKNILLPGAAESGPIESSDDSSSSKRSKKKSTSKRSRSRRRRRSRSRSDSTSSTSSKHVKKTHHGTRPAPVLTKAERLSKFKFM